MERHTGKHLALWGTGGVCRSFLESWPECMPDFFIDSDSSKSGTRWHGREIAHPSAVSDWTEVFVIVATDAYAPIRRQLENKRLKEKADFVWYREWVFDKLSEDVIGEAEKFILNIPEMKAKYRGAKLVFADFLEFDKGVCDFVHQKAVPAEDWVLLSEAGWVREEASKKKLRIPVLKLPLVLAHNEYARDTKSFVLSEKTKQYVIERKYLQTASEGLRGAYPDMAEGYEYIVCFYADKIVRSIIDHWEPSLIALWNSFYPFHAVIRKIGEEKRIPLCYMEFGNIPGTIVCEEGGQMGESYPARHPEEMTKIPVSEEEYKEAENRVKELRASGLNRNVQRTGDGLSAITKRLKPNRPTIFYAGQNDFASGLQPYTENSRKFHSPIFKSSDEAAVFLAGLCKKNNWNFLYKPHPMMLFCTNRDILPDNVIYIEEGNINVIIDASDVVVTILSSVSYIALIRGKPVVMLGYTQLKGTGCTYEAFAKDEAEVPIREAIQTGKTGRMYEYFVRHMARLEKYYT